MGRRRRPRRATRTPAGRAAAASSQCVAWFVLSFELTVAELLPAGGAPDAQLGAPKPRAGKLDDEREHVRARERVDPRASEGSGLARDDLLELREVEEEGIVPHAGEHRHAVVRGDDGRLSMADADRSRLRPVDYPA